MRRHYEIDPSDGRVLREGEEPLSLPGAHRWTGDGKSTQAVDLDLATPLKDGTPCAASGCDGVHRLTRRTVRVGSDDVAVLAAANGTIRAASRLPRAGRLVVLAGGFPVTSGIPYEGPRRSVVACLRAADSGR